jgi:hypothetical protein
MTSSTGALSRLRRPRRAVALGLPIAITSLSIAMITLVGGGASAATTSLKQSYSALTSTAPSTLRLATAQQMATPGFKNDGPTWSTDTPSPSSPLVGTIRQLPMTSPNTTSWIAESVEGDPCILTGPNHEIHGVWVVEGGCATGDDGIVRGTVNTSYDPGAPGAVVLSGVVPNGVTSVQVSFSDGSTQTALVDQNGWTLETTGQPVSTTDLPSGYVTSLEGR